MFGVRPDHFGAILLCLLIAAYGYQACAATLVVGTDSHAAADRSLDLVPGDGESITVTPPDKSVSEIFTVEQSLPEIPIHMGAINPITEGFSVWSYGAASNAKPIVDDKGHAAWSITIEDLASEFSYISGALSPTQKAALKSYGFVLSVGVRVSQGLAPAFDTTNVTVSGAALLTDTGRLQIVLGVDSNGDTVVILPTRLDKSGPGNSDRAYGESYTLSGLGSSYHTYQLVFNPVTQLADLFVDGVKRLQGYAGFVHDNSQDYGLDFGAVSGGQANFDYVNLTIGTQNFPAPTLTEISQPGAVQGDTFNVVFTGTGLSMVNAVISDNPSVTGSIIDRSDTEVTAIITVDPQAKTGETTLGLSTQGGIAKMPFAVNFSEDANLIAHWPFDETVGTTAFDAIGNVDGALVGGASFTVTGGVAGGAIEITEGYVDMGDNFASTSAFSIQAWIKTDPGDTSGMVPVAKHWAGICQGYFLSINDIQDGWTQTNQAGFYSANGCNYHTAVGGPTVNDGNWHQLVGVYDNGTTSLYVDGNLVGSGSSGYANNGAHFMVGGLFNYDGKLISAFHGFIDEVKVYQTALSENDVKMLYDTYISTPGDCNHDGQVSIAEVQAAINMYLGLKPVDSCVDTDNSGNVSIAEVQKVINGYLRL